MDDALVQALTSMASMTSVLMKHFKTLGHTNEEAVAMAVGISRAMMERKPDAPAKLPAETTQT